MTDIAVHQVRGPPAHWRAAHHASADRDEQAGREQPGQAADRVQVEQVLQHRAVALPPGAVRADDEPGRKEDDGRARQGVDPPRDPQRRPRGKVCGHTPSSRAHRPGGTGGAPLRSLSRDCPERSPGQCISSAPAPLGTRERGSHVGPPDRPAPARLVVHLRRHRHPAQPAVPGPGARPVVETVTEQADKQLPVTGAAGRRAVGQDRRRRQGRRRRPLRAGPAAPAHALPLSARSCRRRWPGTASGSTTDPKERFGQLSHFLKNLGLLGGLLLAAVDTEGKPSVGYRARRAAHKAADVDGEELREGPEARRQGTEAGRRRAPRSRPRRSQS